MPPASATAVNNGNGANNNAATNTTNNGTSAAEREERLRYSLKEFILKDRQKKKKEFEAKVEEERLRKEREARERQNDMTLEETRGQIVKLDEKLTELRNQKQQLFLQLKKVLNEDENRKKQQKDNEMLAMQQAMQAQHANVPPPQLFLPQVRVQHNQMPHHAKPAGSQPVKRGRSPSPPAHQAYYKNAAYGQPKHEDARRGADARVLWNKHPTQYQNPGTLFYQTTSNAPPTQTPADTRGPAIIYPAYNMPSLRQGYHLELQSAANVPASKAEQQQIQKPAPVYHINLDQPPISQAGASITAGGLPTTQKQPPQVTMEKISDRYHVEVKHEGPPALVPPHQLPEGVVYTPLIAGMPFHPNVMQMSGNPVQTSKAGASITQGYGPARGAATAHEQHVARQQQMMQGQQGSQQQQQQIHYQRRLF